MKISASAPGRICLFGEHQDYLGLPVVAAAINLRCYIQSSSRKDRQVHLKLMDLGTELIFDLDHLNEPSARNYWLSAMKVAHAEGWLPKWGWNATVTSEIPQQAGASSSSALVVAWCALIAERSGRVVGAQWIAQAAHRAEVEYFHEPGGQMDHYACALGGVQRFGFEPRFNALRLPTPIGFWLLIDSLEPKDTIALLHRTKTRRIQLLTDWSSTWRLSSSALPPPFPEHFDPEDCALMRGTLRLRDISEKGAELIRLNHTEFGSWAPLLTNQHELLRDVLQVSTPRIDEILALAKRNGAWGGKINGSGGGGTCFAVGQEDDMVELFEASKKLGAHVIPIDLGAHGVDVIHQN